MNDEFKIDELNVDKDVKILFMGTPDFAVPILEGLIENYKVKAVVTQPDKKVGREGELTPPPVKKLANDNTILVIQPESINNYIEEINELDVDLIITCAYGQIIPVDILIKPRLGAINVHASLLPKLRGGAPIHRAIIQGHAKTGVTIMKMVKRLDAGDIISQKEIEIDEYDTASSLHDKLSILGTELLLETLPSIINQTAEFKKQDESEATFASNISREDERIDFSKSKKQVYNKIRGLNSWPGAYCTIDSKNLKVWDSYTTDNYFNNVFDGEVTAIYEDGFGVKVANGEVVITSVQPEGKPKMSALDFARGYENKGGLVGKILV